MGNGIDISVYSEDLQNDYISLTDIVKKREGEYPGYVIQNWLRNKSTVAFVGLWESIHNPNFKCDWNCNKKRTKGCAEAFSDGVDGNPDFCCKEGLISE